MKDGVFPGTKLVGVEAERVINKINSVQNPYNISNSENIRSWINITDVGYAVELMEAYPLYYLLYEHPVHQYLNKLFLVERVDAISFFKSKINPGKMEGIDVTIASKDFLLVITCNHDGDIFLVKF